MKRVLNDKINHAYNQEVVPDSLQFPGIVGVCLCLHNTCKYRNEKRRAEEAGVDCFILYF